MRAFVRLIFTTSHTISFIILGISFLAPRFTDRKGQQQASMNTQTRPEDHIASLKTWLESQGGALHPSVQIAHDDDSGYHLRASSPVPANTSMVTVPFHSTFSILTSTVSWPDIIDMLLPVESPYMVMTRFAFVREYLLGKESQWYPYIAMLPQPSQVRAFPVQWEDGSDEMKWIRGTSLEESRSKKLETWKWEWEMGMKQLRGQEWAWDGGETRITWYVRFLPSSHFYNLYFASDHMHRILRVGRSQLTGCDEGNYTNGQVQSWLLEHSHKRSSLETTYLLNHKLQVSFYRSGRAV